MLSLRRPSYRSQHWKGNMVSKSRGTGFRHQRDVDDELRWDPDLDAKRVAGVVGVASDIEVRLPVVDERPGPLRCSRGSGLEP
jgi:hypothetical protein